MSRLPSIEWVSSDVLEVAGRRFHSVTTAGGLLVAPSTADLLLLGKSRAMIDRYVRLAADGDIGRIVELGVFRGGSVGFLAALFRPDLLVAVDIVDSPVEPLEQHLDRHGLRETVSVHYGIDQSDRPALLAVVEPATGGHPLDLVIDDASHVLDLTRASFEILFPLVRPGGRYVIEDWSLPIGTLGPVDEAEESLRARLIAGADEDRSASGPISTLVGELVLATAASPGLIAEVLVEEHMVTVTRGSAVIDPHHFRLADHYRSADGSLLVPCPGSGTDDSSA